MKKHDDKTYEANTKEAINCIEELFKENCKKWHRAELASACIQILMRYATENGLMKHEAKEFIGEWISHIIETANDNDWNYAMRKTKKRL